MALVVSGSIAVASTPVSAAALKYGVGSSIPITSNPRSIAVDEASNTIYASDKDSRSISVVDGDLGVEKAVITPSMLLTSIEVNGAGSRLYATSSSNDKLTAIDPITGETVFTSLVGDQPQELTIDDVRGVVWVVNQGSDSLSAIDAISGEPLASAIAVGDKPTNLALDESTNLLYVTNIGSGTVSVVDGNQMKVIRTVAVEKNPSGVVVDAASHVAYVTHGESGAVSVIGPQSPAHAPHFDFQGLGLRIALDPSTNDMILTSYGYGNLIAADRDTGKVSYIQAAPNTQRIEMNSQTGTLYLASELQKKLFLGTKGAAPVITSTKLSSSATATVPYTAAPLKASGVGPIAWSIVASRAGVGIDEQTGVISGTPEQRGTYPMTIRATNPFGYDDVDLTLWIAERPAVAPTVHVPVGYRRPLLNLQYSAWVTSDGYPAPSIAVSGLPKGLEFSRGYIRGTPRKLGTYSVTVTATNASGSDSVTYPLTVVGKGKIRAFQWYEGKHTKIGRYDRKELRQAVKGMRKGAVVEEYYINSEMYDSGNPKKDLSTAKKKAFKVSAFLRSLGVKAKPTYHFYVETESQNKTTTGSVFIDYSYTK